MDVSIYLNLAQLLFTHHCLSNIILTEKYTKLPTSPKNLVAIRHFKATLLKCTVLCSEHAHACPNNIEPDVNMSEVTGSCNEARKCMGFRFDNGVCVLYKKGQQAWTIVENIKSQLYVRSGILQVESRDEGTVRSGSTVNDNSETTSSTIKKDDKIGTDKHPATWGSLCSKSDQCDYDHGLCLSGKCTCRIGHSFDFNSNTCVTHCKQYGRDLSLYPKSSINGCNTVTHPIVFTIDTCIKRCLQETSFVCVNAEYNHKRLHCNLCNTTWSELDDEQRRDGTRKSKTLIYRHCAKMD